MWKRLRESLLDRQSAAKRPRFSIKRYGELAKPLERGRNNVPRPQPAALVGLGFWLARPSAEAALLVVALGQAFLGLEAPALTRDRLARRGFGLVDVVVGERREDVETLFYRRRSLRRATASFNGDAA